MSELLVYEIVLYTSCAWGATTLTTQIEHKNGNFQKEHNLPNQILTRKTSSFSAKFAGSQILQWKSRWPPFWVIPPNERAINPLKKSNYQWGKEN